MHASPPPHCRKQTAPPRQPRASSLCPSSGNPTRRRRDRSGHGRPCSSARRFAASTQSSSVRGLPTAHLSGSGLPQGVSESLDSYLRVWSCSPCLHFARRMASQSLFFDRIGASSTARPEFCLSSKALLARRHSRARDSASKPEVRWNTYGMSLLTAQSHSRVGTDQGPLLHRRSRLHYVAGGSYLRLGLGR